MNTKIKKYVSQKLVKNETDEGHNNKHLQLQKSIQYNQQVNPSTTYYQY